MVTTWQIYDILKVQSFQINKVVSSSKPIPFMATSVIFLKCNKNLEKKLFKLLNTYKTTPSFEG